jgi:hypothetical protein
MPVERRHDGEGCSGERRRRGGATERGHCGEVSFFFFRTVGGQVDKHIRYGFWAASRPTIGTVQADGCPIPSITVNQKLYKAFFDLLIYLIIYYEVLQIDNVSL